MTHVIARNDLVSALETCAPLCSQRHLNPAYSRVRLSLNHELRFAATDAIVTVTGSRPLERPADLRETSVDCRSLLDAALRMPDSVTVSFKWNQIELKSGKRVFRIATLDDELGPDVKRPDSGFTKLPARPVLEALDRIRWATTTEDGKPKDISLTIHNRSIRARGIHGHKCAEFSATIESGESVKVLIPVLLLPSFTAAAEASQEIGILDDGASLWLDTEPGLFRYLSSVERRFPDHMFDQGVCFDVGDKPVGFEIDSEPLAEAIKYASIAARDGEQNRIMVESQDGELHVSAEASSSGRDTRETIEAETLGHTKFLAEPGYLLEALRHGGERVTVRMDSRVDRVMKNSPVLLNPVVFTSEGYRACVMPQAV